jgi:hypothetical protein
VKKSFVYSFPQGSIGRIITHAAYQASRGRQPSLGFMGITNPMAALKIALEMCELCILLSEKMDQRHAEADMIGAVMFQYG